MRKKKFQLDLKKKRNRARKRTMQKETTLIGGILREAEKRTKRQEEADRGERNAKNGMQHVQR